MPSYAKVKYEGVYPGVDLARYGNQGGQLEYDLVVAPGADQGARGFSIAPGFASNKLKLRLKPSLEGDRA